ncbi:XVIPCD domain-containing protein [Frateuria defendens]|uniref:XVIPCD domain-containing protein n=1 Tax=Frateuria defendens TaxID=2219559 RepID=UPI00066FD7CA|nr:XVIPCD domain-containing protein [Frateuria defendens]
MPNPNTHDLDALTGATYFVRSFDAAHGRTPDQKSANFAGALTTSARAAGLKRIDHVVMSDDGKRAYAVQGELNSPFKKIAEVDVGQAVATPLEHSSAEFQRLSQPQQEQQPGHAQPQRQPQQLEPQGVHR